MTYFKKPGEAIDRKGIPVYPGDLIRTDHFKGRNRRMHYLYHTAVWDAERNAMWMIPTSHLEPSKKSGGGSCPITDDQMRNAEVIEGFGPGDILSHYDRPKVKRKDHLHD